jgi:Rrf2 family protein
MELTRKTEYAIAILTELAEQESDRPLQSKEVGRRRNIPQSLVPRIVATLSNKGWIEGTRGVGGGIRLVVDPATISVLDVIELIEGPIHINYCLKSGQCAKESRCLLHRVWVAAQEAMEDVFRSTTIAELCRPAADKDTAP